VAAVLRADSAARSAGPPPYTGYDARGVPHYARLALSSADSALLRAQFGVDDPGLLYVSDSTPGGYLKFDVSPDGGTHDYVDSYGIGFASVRHRGETWRAFDARIHHTPRSAFPANIMGRDRSLADLDPAVQPLFTRMVADAARAGFHLTVSESYRSPEREAFLLSLGKGRTYTATSLHSYGRAVDFLLDGHVGPTRRTRAHWIAFRSWVLAYDPRLSLLGTPSRTWDWAHVQVAEGLGFRTVDQALAAARACASGQAAAVGLTPDCTFPDNAGGATR